jgi:hypothetical protein
VEVQVSQDIIERATKCRRQFVCLSGDVESLCRVRHYVSGKVHFVECTEDSWCNSRFLFGDDWVCVCPVRKEIYMLYGV